MSRRSERQRGDRRPRRRAARRRRCSAASSACSPRARTARSTASTTRCSSPTPSPRRPARFAEDGRVNVRVVPALGSVELHVGPLRADGADELVASAALPGRRQRARAGSGRARAAAGGRRRRRVPAHPPGLRRAAPHPRSTEWRSMSPEFAITEHPIDGERHVLAVRGEIDLFTAPELKQVLAESIEAGRDPHRRRPHRDDVPGLDRARRADRRRQAAALARRRAGDRQHRREHRQDVRDHRPRSDLHDRRHARGGRRGRRAGARAAG